MMSVNRSLFHLRKWGTLFSQKRLFGLTAQRNSGHDHHIVRADYRNCQGPVTGKRVKYAKYGAVMMWVYVLHSAWHDPGVALGHNFWPDPKKYTDEELGIPPDDIDLEDI